MTDVYTLKKEARTILDEYGPLSHEDLTERLGCEWDETQKAVRALRTEGEVVITLDRRYESTED